MSAVLDADHYTIRGQKFVRVTRLLAWAGVNDFTKIPARDRSFYMDRGRGTHLLWQLVEEGTDHYYTFDPRVESYRPAHRQFLDDTGFKAMPQGIEKRVHATWSELGLTGKAVDGSAGLAGTLDRLGLIQGRITLLDFKSTSVPPSTALQTALYLLLMPKYPFHEVRRHGVAFRADGQYRMTSAYPYADKEEALRLLYRYHHTRRS